MNQKYIDFLKEKIDEYCNENKCYEYYWDYREEIDPDVVLEALRIIKDDKSLSFECALEDALTSNGWMYDCEYELIRQIKSDIDCLEDDEIIKTYEDREDLIWDDLYEAGYAGFDLNIKDGLRLTRLKVNVLFGTEIERNFDMCSIIETFGHYNLPDLDYIMSNLEQGYDITVNALTYLIHQQGYSILDVYKRLFYNERGFSEPNSFVDSIVNEIVNNPSEGMSELTCLVELSGEDIITFFNTLNSSDKYLVFEKNTVTGLFNEWSGGGSLLDIYLEKPFVVPTSMVRDVQIEGASKYYSKSVKTSDGEYISKKFIQQGYTVDSVYGLMGTCWKDCVSYTDNKPVIIKETFNEVYNAWIDEAPLDKDEFIEYLKSRKIISKDALALVQNILDYAENTDESKHFEILNSLLTEPFGLTEEVIKRIQL